MSSDSLTSLTFELSKNDKNKSREKNKLHSAVCLKKKKQNLTDNQELCDKLQLEINILQSQIHEKEKTLCLGSCQEDLFNFLQYYNNNKQAIEKMVEHGKSQDQNLIKRQKALADAENELKVKKEHNDNKREMAVRENVSTVTIATRYSRAKFNCDMCFFSVKAMILEYEIRKCHQILDLLNQIYNLRVSCIQYVITFQLPLIMHIPCNVAVSQLKRPTFVLH